MNYPIKILYITNCSDMDKGGQVSLFNLVKRINMNRFEPLVLCPGHGSLSSFLNSEGIKTEFLEFPSLKLNNFQKLIHEIKRLRRIVINGGYQVIHTDSPRDTFLSAIAVLFTQVKIVWHARVSHKDPVFDFINKYLVIKIIGVSNAVFERFRSILWNSKRYITIYNGVDLTKFSRTNNKKNIRKEIGVDKGNILVTTVMQVIPIKGSEEFIRAALSICKVKSDISFVIIGVWQDEAFIKKLEEIANEHINRILFLGYRREVWDIFNNTDIFVLPSWRYVEGLPRVVIEAMAFGLPVVGTDVEGINEAVIKNETGLLIPEKNFQALAGAILELSKNKEKRKKFGINGRKRTELFFNIIENVRKIEDTYMELLKE